jgi:hypothetical protein
MKKQPDDIARGEQAADRAVCSIKHLRVGVDLQSAEGERDAAGNGIGPVGRLVDGIGPVGFFGAIPSVQRPSILVASNRISLRTALLNSRIV